MSTFEVDLAVGDAAGQRFETFRALVDTGSTFTVVSRSVLEQLGVAPLTTSRFELGDGRVIEMQVGQTWVRLNGSARITQVVFGDDGVAPAVGAVTLEAFLLAPDPVHQRLIPVNGLMR